MCPYKYLYMNAPSSLICNSLKLGTNQMSTNREMDKQSVVYPHNGILFSKKREGTIHTHYCMDKPQNKLC